MESPSTSTSTEQSAIYRNPDSIDELTSVYNKKVNTLWDNFALAAAKFRNNNFLAHRERKPDGTVGAYKTMTYAEAGAQVACLGSFFQIHLNLDALAPVAIWSLNRPEWDITEQACNSQSLVSVPLYATLGPDAVHYVLNHAECTVAVISARVFPGIINCLDKTQVEAIVCMDEITEEMTNAVAKKKPSCQLFSWAQAQNLGKDKLVMPRPPKSTDLASLIYTSGTTGNPKGVIHTHGTLVAALSGLLGFSKFFSTDRYLSFLPSAHIYARLVHAIMIKHGAAIYFFQGDPLKLFQDAMAAKPTFFCGVPRVFSKIHLKVNSVMKQKGEETWNLYQNALQAKLKIIKSGQRESPLDPKLFKPIRAMLGLEECRFLLSGAAPLDNEVQDWLQCVFAPCIQGYGLTETGAALAVQPVGASYHAPLISGVPLTCCEVKLRSIPEMNYLTTNDPPCGEILTRGPNVFKGYYKDEEKTAQVLDKDGWFSTGDVGRWNPDNTLSVIDRVKNIFKLSQGEYVAAEYVEGVYSRSPLIQQIFVYGDSLKDRLVAIVVPFPPTLQAVAKQNNIPDADNAEDLMKSAFTKAAIMSQLEKFGGEAQLRGFEKVAAIHIDTVPFSVEQGLITPTFKFRRPQLRDHYQSEIDSMYASLASE